MEGPAARRDKRKRQERIHKAEKALKNKVYSCQHVYEKYIKNYSFVLSTGEYADGSVSSIDYDRIDNEEKYDGYFAIITSELSYDEKKIREVYHGLWRIEESFRITKSDLAARPIFVRTENHIKGHLLICFIELVLLRILQHKMNYSLSTERIIRALHMCSCSEVSKGIIHVIKKDTFEKYNMIIDSNGSEYYTLNLSDTKKRNC